jgi:hypothetical protein
MSDDELHLLIQELETRIERLGEIAEGCRKWILLAKLAMVAGGVWLVAIVTGFASLDPASMLVAIAALLGGIVLAGSNASTLDRTKATIKDTEALRIQAIDDLQLSAVEGGSRRLH